MISNKSISDDMLAQRSFAALLGGLGAARLLDVGANIGNFAMQMRGLGFTGFIYSVEPQASCRRQMTQSSREDLRWIVLPNQGAGAQNGVMNLNVAENSYSSSFLVPHANHLRAEPAVRVVSGEWVYISKTCDLLPPATTGTIDALKIDTQGYELHTLQGLAGRFDGLKLIMAELSAIPTYADGPSLAEVEGYILGEIGFERVSLTPAYVDETSGEIQQYDGIYVRRDLVAEATALLAEAAASAAAPAGPGVRLDAVVVSLPAQPPKRPQSGRDFGPAWLQSCHRSWTSHAAQVISISEAAPILPGVNWRKVASKPTLLQMLSSLADAPPPGEGAILLTNADIILGPQLGQLLAQMDPHVLYYCSRLDVAVSADNPGTLEALGEYTYGYDAFFLPRATIAAILAQRLIPANLKIGEPFWDYALPIAALMVGHPAKKFFTKSHPIVHLKHDTISNSYLAATAPNFVSWLKQLLQRPASPASGMVAAFLAAYDGTPGDEKSRRDAMCRAIITGLT